ncbi:unnamed protein product [Periconia digitata]|uniref:Uncharacterized protein n=1 Tax=Periconia digitata TaxID=1303443 RepID=A0A9W4UCN6_9PLEO|nr:unnamed protein product [Periconia digitata]
MAGLTVLIILSWLLAGASCSTFINPGPSSGKEDDSTKPSYPQGSNLEISWTPPDNTSNGVSIVLYQLNQTTKVYFDDMEYLTQGAVGVTRYAWLVGTRKNLKVSNLFYLSIFEEGKANADANSRQFNIEAEKDKDQPSSTSNDTPSSTTPITSSKPTNGIDPKPGAPTNAGTTVNSIKNSPSSTSSEIPTTNNNDGFPIDAKIGIAASVPIAVIISAGLIAFLLKRRKDNKRQESVPITTAAPPIEELQKHYHNHPGSYHHYASSMSEAPSHMYDDPIELGARPQAHPRLATEPVRYEM